MENQVVTRKALKEIYNSVCSNWQTKIDTLLAEYKFDDEISVPKTIVLQAYSEADANQKKWLEKNLPKPKTIADQVKDYKSACEINGETPKTLKDFEEFYGKDNAKREFAGFKIKAGIRAINEGWYPNFNNDNQRKYYIWKYNKNNGFGFFVDCRYCSSYVGADFYIKSEKKARIIHNAFEDEIKEYYF